MTLAMIAFLARDPATQIAAAAAAANALKRLWELSRLATATGTAAGVAGAAGGSAALAAAPTCILQGDTSPHTLPDAKPDDYYILTSPEYLRCLYVQDSRCAWVRTKWVQLEGEDASSELLPRTRYAPRASADGTVVALPALDAVDLPVAASPTALDAAPSRLSPDDVRFLQGLWAQLLARTDISKSEKRHLQGLARQVKDGTLTVAELVDQLEQFQERELLRHFTERGWVARIVGSGENRVLEIDCKTISDPLLRHALEDIFALRIQLLLWNHPRVRANPIYNPEKNLIRMPPRSVRLKWIRELYPDAPDVVYVNGEVPEKRLVRLHRNDTSALGVTMEHNPLLGDLGFNVDGYIYGLHDDYHHARQAAIGRPARDFAVQLHDIITEFARLRGDNRILKDMRTALADMDVTSIDVLYKVMLQDVLRKTRRPAIPPEDRQKLLELKSFIQRSPWIGPHADHHRKTVQAFLDLLQKVTEGH